MDITRRGLLSAAGVAGASALAGCTGGQASSSAASATATAQASFFVFGDIAAAVAGETATAELLVPVGQHGHGWAPGPRVREAIRDSPLLFHGMPGFQPWVDSITTDLAADAPDVTAVDVSAGLELLAPRGGHDDGDHEDGHDEEHSATETGDHEDGHDEEHGDDHDAEHSATETGGHDGDDDHGAGMDPHFWMDPLRVRTAAETVREGFAGVDAANADAYADHTAAFQRDLDALHDRLETLVADASRDVLLVAGHDSAQYLSARYGVEVEALTSVSPDDRPTPRDIERAQAVIDRYDLRYICADPLESQQAAEQLVAATDAEAVLPLTAMPGLTEAWASDGWGYLDVMENVNRPTLAHALGAE